MNEKDNEIVICKKLLDIYAEGYNTDYHSSVNFNIDDKGSPISRVCILDHNEINIDNYILFRVRRVIEDMVIHDLDILYTKYNISVYIVSNYLYNQIGNQIYWMYFKRKRLCSFPCPPTIPEIASKISRINVKQTKKHIKYFNLRYRVEHILYYKLKNVLVNDCSKVMNLNDSS